MKPYRSQTNDLFYGHFGTPIYDRHTQAWKFPRDTSQSGRLKAKSPLREWAASSQSVHVPSIYRGAVTAQAQAVVEDNPEFGALEGRLEDGFFYQFAADHTRDLNRLKTNLLAVGAAKSSHASSASDVPLFAAVAGSCGEIIKVFSNARAYDTSRAPPGVGQALAPLPDCAHWQNELHPVLQLAFSSPKATQSKCLLAVRYELAIIVLEVCLEEQPSTGHVSSAPLAVFPPSTISAHPIVTLTADVALDQIALDMAFNQWNSHQLATLDPLGLCTVYGLARSEEDAEWSFTVHSTLQLNANNQSASQVTCAKIMWVDEGNMMLAVFQNRVRVSTMGTTTAPVFVPGLALEQNGDWVLDVRLSPSHPSRVYILTTSRLSLHQIEHSGAGNSEPSVATLLTWQHYRDDTDLSLRLCIQKSPTADNTTLRSTASSIVLVYSQTNSMMTLFTLHEDLTGTFVQSRPDPYELAVPYTHEIAFKENGNGFVAALPMTVSLVAQRINSGEGDTSQEAMGNVVFTMYILGPDLRFCSVAIAREDVKVPEAITAPSAQAATSNITSGDDGSDTDSIIVTDALAIEELVAAVKPSRPAPIQVASKEVVSTYNGVRNGLFSLGMSLNMPFDLNWAAQVPFVAADSEFREHEMQDWAADGTAITDATLAYFANALGLHIDDADYAADKYEMVLTILQLMYPDNSSTDNSNDASRMRRFNLETVARQLVQGANKIFAFNRDGTDQDPYDFGPQRIQLPTTANPDLDSGLVTVLNQWDVGANPAQHDWVSSMEDFELMIAQDAGVVDDAGQALGSDLPDTSQASQQDTKKKRAGAMGPPPLPSSQAKQEDGGIPRIGTAPQISMSQPQHDSRRSRVGVPGFGANASRQQPDLQPSSTLSTQDTDMTMTNTQDSTATGDGEVGGQASTQPEPGRYGSRTATGTKGPAKGKKRKAGF